MLSAMSEYKATIGLEIHAELKTVTKMFCESKNDPDETTPNTNICPVCMGHPGTLPVINKTAVAHVLSVGAAVNGNLADFTEFDRKNYFYPDIPKGYQISQYKYPLVSGGNINNVLITRIHLEEDTARSSHESGEGSLVDFNRAGVPLMELVTEPVIRDAKQASDFAKELQLILRYIGASDANMEKGEMRVEANVSVANDERLGTKVEVKNLNSFRSVERAIEYEIKRQSELLKKGEKVAQETRGWDESSQKTFSQRAKEESHDYRYFPDPDLPKILLSRFEVFKLSRLVELLPELPNKRRSRLLGEYELSKDTTEILVQDFTIKKLFDEVVVLCANQKRQIQLAANYLTSDILGMLGKDQTMSLRHITANNLKDITSMLDNGELSSRGAKDILTSLLKEPGDAVAMATELGILQQNNEDVLVDIVNQVIEDNKSVVEMIKSGKDSSIQFLIGQAMRASKGSANPKLLQKLFKQRLSD